MCCAVLCTLYSDGTEVYKCERISSFQKRRIIDPNVYVVAEVRHILVWNVA